MQLSHTPEDHHHHQQQQQSRPQTHIAHAGCAVGRVVSLFSFRLSLSQKLETLIPSTNRENHDSMGWKTLRGRAANGTIAAKHSNRGLPPGWVVGGWVRRRMFQPEIRRIKSKRNTEATQTHLCNPVIVVCRSGMSSPRPVRTMCWK